MLQCGEKCVSTVAVKGCDNEHLNNIIQPQNYLVHLVSFQVHLPSSKFWNFAVSETGDNVLFNIQFNIEFNNYNMYVMKNNEYKYRAFVNPIALKTGPTVQVTFHHRE